MVSAPWGAPHCIRPGPFLLPPLHDEVVKKGRSPMLRAGPSSTATCRVYSDVWGVSDPSLSGPISVDIDHTGYGPEGPSYARRLRGEPRASESGQVVQTHLSSCDSAIFAGVPAELAVTSSIVAEASVSSVALPHGGRFDPVPVSRRDGPL
jgi:hypothetical protein